jgi:hypothetical protein
MTSCDLADFGDLVLHTPTKPVAMSYPGSRYGDPPSLAAIIQESSGQSLILARFWPCSSLQLCFFLVLPTENLRKGCAKHIGAWKLRTDAESLWSITVSTDLSTVEKSARLIFLGDVHACSYCFAMFLPPGITEAAR